MAGMLLEVGADQASAHSECRQSESRVIKSESEFRQSESPQSRPILSFTHTHLFRCQSLKSALVPDSRLQRLPSPRMDGGDVVAAEGVRGGGGLLGARLVDRQRLLEARERSVVVAAVKVRDAVVKERGGHLESLVAHALGSAHALAELRVETVAQHPRPPQPLSAPRPRGAPNRVASDRALGRAVRF